jgi:murein DD-endopeptidase MepM/ murein hydrolase activator NlpD
VKRFTLSLVACLAVASVGHAGVQPDATPQGSLALAALDRRIADLDAEEQSSKKELNDIGPQIRNAHLQVLARGRDFYKLTRAGMLPVGGGFDALVRHAMKVERSRRLLERGLDEETRVRVRGAELARSLERVAKDREALAGQRTAMDSARLAMEDEKRRQAAFDLAFDGSGRGDYVAIGGGGVDLGASGGFQTSRGKLLFPVAGRADVRNAKRDGTDGPGLEILAPLNSVVRAVFAGRVAFSDRYGAYGRIVILDHGDHYYSVSGNLGSIDVHVGDDISAGERVGTVGDDGQGAMLYFEIRHGSQTVPPAPWLGL